MSWNELLQRPQERSFVAPLWGGKEVFTGKDCCKSPQKNANKTPGVVFEIVLFFNVFLNMFELVLSGCFIMSLLSLCLSIG